MALASTGLLKQPHSIYIKVLLYFFCFLSLLSCSSLRSEVFEYTLPPDGNGNHHMEVTLQGSIGMKSARFNNLPVKELSGIAWDNDEKLLYAVSDAGLLYHLKLAIKNKHLNDMQVVYATRLKNKSNKRLRGKFSDAEGLSLVNGNNGKQGDSILIISFENKPRISRYSPQGEFLANISIPKYLKNRKNFRHTNKALESVTQHPVYGTLTAAEFPLKKDSMKSQTLYSSSGNQWHFPASSSKNSAITGLETLPNGDILVLERAWSNIFTPITINLRQLEINNCNDNNECPTRKIAKLSGADGWLLDNFEGLAHYDGNQYLMISDNNHNPLQSTILVLLEVNL